MHLRPSWTASSARRIHGVPNILITQRSLRALIEAAIGVLQQQMRTVEQEVASVFCGIQDKVANAFGSLTSDILGAYSTFSSLPKQVPGGSASAPRLGSPSDADPPPVAGSSSVHHNWFITKVLDHITPSSSIAAIPGLDLGAFLGALDLDGALGTIHQS